MCHDFYFFKRYPVYCLKKTVLVLIKQMEVIHELNAKLDKLIKLDPSQYATSAALLYLKVDGACKKIDLIHKSFVKLVATVESMRKVTIPSPILSHPAAWREWRLLRTKCRGFLAVELPVPRV